MTATHELACASVMLRGNRPATVKMLAKLVLFSSGCKGVQTSPAGYGLKLGERTPTIDRRASERNRLVQNRGTAAKPPPPQDITHNQHMTAAWAVFACREGSSQHRAGAEELEIIPRRGNYTNRLRLIAAAQIHVGASVICS